MIWNICIDLGGTKIEIALVSNRGEIYSRVKIPTHPERGVQHAIQNIGRTVREMIQAAPSHITVTAVACCTPGPINNSSGVLYNAVNLKWGEVPLQRLLETELQMPTIVEHDAKAAALGEYYFGLRESEKNFVYIVIGTGVGGAIVSNGAVLRGITNGAGEIGHISINCNATEHSHDGIRGSLEAYLAGPHVIAYYKKIAVEQGLPIASKQISATYIGERATHGDPLAQKALERSGKALGILVSSLAMILDIDLFIMGSSVAKLGQHLIKPALKAVPDYCHPHFAHRIRIQAGTLIDDAPLLGCNYLLLSR